MLECFSRIDDIPNLEKQWDALYESSGVDNLFLTYTWIHNWLKWFSKGEHIILVDRVEERLRSVGVFHWQQKKVTFISRDHSTWPNILSLSNCEMPFGPYLKYLYETRKADWIRLQSAPGDDSFFRELNNVASHHYYTIRHYPHCTRSVNIQDTFDGFLMALPKKVRSELRRKHKKLVKKLSDVSLISHETPGDVDEVFRKLSYIEKDSWKQKSGTAIICSEEEIGFYRDVFCFNNDSFKGRAFFLMNKDEPLAYVIGVIFNRRFYALKTSYQNRFAALSPGQVLFYCLIDHFSNENREIDLLELLGGDARWKREIGSNEHSLCNIELLRKSIKSSVIVFAWHHVLPYINDITEKYPKISSTKEKLIETSKRFLHRS